MDKTSIGIIGMGWVGSSVAISILHQGFCRELLLSDVRTEIAEGEAMDLTHGSSFYPGCKVRAASIDEMHQCKAIVITAGRGGKPGETRLELLGENVKIAREISNRLKGYQGFLVIVSNPVDVLTYFYQKFTGLPKSKVIGTGTMLDTARLREMIGQEINLDAKTIHAQVVGEHGDSKVALWSLASIGGVRLRKWKGWEISKETRISEQVRTAAQEIIKRKGATNHAIGLVTGTLLKWIIRGDRRIVNVSTVLDGQYGHHDVAFSLPTVLTGNGAEEVMELEMNEEELEALNASAEILKKAIQSVDIS